MRLHGFLCVFLALEDDVAGGIVDPFDSEVGIDVEVVANHLVAHVVYAEKIPTVWT
jgi:hypothetical protein